MIIYNIVVNTVVSTLTKYLKDTAQYDPDKCQYPERRILKGNFLEAHKYPCSPHEVNHQLNYDAGGTITWKLPGATIYIQLKAYTGVLDQK